MGKKSRLKRIRRELAPCRLSSCTEGTLSNLLERNLSVFRYFDEAWKADALAAGDVWVSTLGECRKYENSAQGDREEAHETYNSGYIRGNGDNPALVEIGRRCGIEIGPGCQNITLSNNTRITSIPDAYVLCTTRGFVDGRLTEDFGQYCVEITNPMLFFQCVSSKLMSDIAMSSVAAGEVIYSDRYYRGLQKPPGPIGFVKPADQYASQNEFRFLWVPRSTNDLSPFLLPVPEVASICRRVL